MEDVQTGQAAEGLVAVTSFLVRKARLRYRGRLNELADRLGVTGRTLGRWEKGLSLPGPSSRARLAEEAGISPALVEALLRVFRAHQLGAARSAAADEPRRDLLDEVRGTMAEVVERAAGLLSVQPSPEPWERVDLPGPEERSWAEELWRRYIATEPGSRVSLVRESVAFHTVGFCDRLCRESVRVAAGSTGDALALAQLAVEVARKVPGSRARRDVVEGYALCHVANAQRVGNELEVAEQTFARGRQLLARGEAELPRLLEKSRALDLEASLRRDQSRLVEALTLLEKALACGSHESSGRLLLNKAFTLEQMGDFSAALAVLERADPLVEATGVTRDRCVLRFNTAVCLCHLDRAGEAEALLPEIQSLAIELGHTLDLLRTRWLEGRVAAGLGRTAEALAILDEVCDAFLRHDPPLPCDAALAGLDLALYWFHTLFRELK